MIKGSDPPKKKTDYVNPYMTHTQRGRREQKGQREQLVMGIVTHNYTSSVQEEQTKSQQYMTTLTVDMPTVRGWPAHFGNATI